MKRSELERMSVEQLVDRFTTIALDQDSAKFLSDTKKFNRLFDEMGVVKEVLKARPGDQRRALIPLYRHPNAQVRLTAAILTLALEPQAARNVLQLIVDREEYPQRVDALGIIRSMDAGTHVPN